MKWFTFPQEIPDSFSLFYAISWFGSITIVLLLILLPTLLLRPKEKSAMESLSIIFLFLAYLFFIMMFAIYAIFFWIALRPPLEMFFLGGALSVLYAISSTSMLGYARGNKRRFAIWSGLAGISFVILVSLFALHIPVPA